MSSIVTSGIDATKPEEVNALTADVRTNFAEIIAQLINAGIDIDSKPSISYVDAVPRIEMLDSPQLLLSVTATIGTWTTADLSSFGGEANIAASRGAIAAILRIVCAGVSSGGEGLLILRAQKAGLGGGGGGLNTIVIIREPVGDQLAGAIEAHVKLDLNSDFEYQAIANNAIGVSMGIYLVGYHY